jgi:tetratricopeptide (TPR) repeat protein
MTDLPAWCRRALVGAALCLVAAPAAAQAPLPQETSEVDARLKGKALYDEGVRLMDVGRVAEACPKFESALRVDPGRIGVMLKLAGCYEALGRVASAKTAYEIAEAAAQKAGDARAADARAKARELAPRLPRLTLTAGAAAGVQGLSVQRDGGAIDRELLGVPVPVDPGAHVIVASAPGRKPWREEIQLAEGASRSLEIPDLALDAAAPAPLGPGPAPPPPAPGVLWSTPRVAGVALAALGVAGLAAGAVTGVLAIQKRNDSNAGHCMGNACDTIGVGLRSDSIAAGNASTALFAIGGAAAVAGVVLVVVAPQKQSVSIALGPATLTARGRW